MGAEKRNLTQVVVTDAMMRTYEEYLVLLEGTLESKYDDAEEALTRACLAYARKLKKWQPLVPEDVDDWHGSVNGEEMRLESAQIGLRMTIPVSPTPMKKLMKLDRARHEAWMQKYNFHLKKPKGPGLRRYVRDVIEADPHVFSRVSKEIAQAIERLGDKAPDPGSWRYL